MQQTQKVYIGHLDKMRPLAFISFMKMIDDDYAGRLSEDEVSITEKIDGSALRFGVNRAGDLFVESATSPAMFTPGDFERRDKSKGHDGSIGRNFDYILEEMQNDRSIYRLLHTYGNYGIKIVGEILFMPMARLLGGNTVQFVRIPYCKTSLGSEWTFVPIKVLDCDGNRHPLENEVLQEMTMLSTDKRKYVRPFAKLLDDEPIDLMNEIASLNKYIASRDYDLEEMLLTRKKCLKAVKELAIADIQKHQKAVRNKILAHVDHGCFGPFIEGLVIEFPDGTLLKVITDEFINTSL